MTDDDATITDRALTGRQKQARMRAANAPRLKAEQVERAREWLLDCDWADEDAEEVIRAAPPALIERRVAQHYDGGIAGFLRDDT